jgi:hypothetical protein
VIRNVYAPSGSLFEREIRPWKATLFNPLWPMKESVPCVTVRLQLLLCRFRLVWGTQLPPTRRPATCWVKAKLTTACWLRTNLNVVPTGGLLRE